MLIDTPEGWHVRLGDVADDASHSAPRAGAMVAAYEWQSSHTTISSVPTFTFGLDEGTYTGSR